MRAKQQEVLEPTLGAVVTLTCLGPCPLRLLLPLRHLAGHGWQQHGTREDVRTEGGAARVGKAVDVVWCCDTIF